MNHILTTREKNLFAAKWRAFVIVISLLLLAGSVSAMAQTENVIYRFKGGSDGMEPLGSLISDNAGNFYGTTCGNDSTIKGTVFQVAIEDGRWTETTLYAFASGDASCPYGELIFDPAGNLYGTAYGPSGASSTVFQLKPPTVQGDSWTENVLFSFESGYDLNDGLVFDKAGNLYGSTYSGGEKGKGMVFELSPSQDGTWSATVIHAFTGADGSYPVDGPIIDSEGNLYGPLQQGPNFDYDGAIYELEAPSTQGGAWLGRVLYSFKGGSDGAGPAGPLNLDQKGNLDGITYSDGANNGGAVFELTPKGNSWAKTVIYNFCAQANCTDGSTPIPGLVIDGKGNLYGITMHGGTGAGADCNAGGCGTLFELSPPTPGGTWTETVLHNFGGSSGDGYLPRAGVIQGRSGSLWGTTPSGGNLSALPCTYIDGCGTVFNVHP
jgi:uncharacterized repeat protein (TIGR03803 family)